jgi:hypothetical protein
MIRLLDSVIYQPGQHRFVIVIEKTVKQNT